MNFCTIFIVIYLPIYQPRVIFTWVTPSPLKSMQVPLHNLKGYTTSGSGSGVKLGSTRELEMAVLKL